MQFTLSLNEDFEQLYDIHYNEEVYKLLGISNYDLDIMNFRNNFIYKGANLADISVDANANVNQKTFIQYKEDMSKPFAKIIAYNTLYTYLDQYYDTETADKCVGKLLTGEIFLNDATSFDLPYCYAFDLDPLYVEGYEADYFKIKPAQSSTTFCNQVIQILAEFSNHILGAVAFPNFFVILDWFLRQEYGEVYTETIRDNKEIKQLFQHLVFSFNWNYRGGQTAFLNLSILDEGFLKQMFGEYVYRDFSKPNFNSIKELSKAFFENFDDMYGKEGMFTYPVHTLAMSLDEEKNYIDEVFVQWATDINSKKSTGNILLSEATCFSSCCFAGDQKVLTSNANLGLNLRTIKEVIEDSGNDLNTNFKVFHNGHLVKAKKVKIPIGTKKLYQILTSKNSILKVTEDHLHLTDKGLIATKDLTCNHWLATSCLPLNITSDTTRTSNLTYEQGVLIGTYVGDGYKYKKQTSNSYEVAFSLSENKLHLIPLLEKGLRDFGIEKKLNKTIGEHNVIFFKCYSEELFNIMNTYVKGDKALEKELILDTVLREALDFREGLKFGWYSTDGSNGNRIYTASDKLLETGQALLVSLGYITHIWTDVRDTEITFRGHSYERNANVKCLKWQKTSSKRGEKNIYKTVNNTIYIKIKEIKEINYEDDYVYCFDMETTEEPYFTLPNGIITHNCRLKSNIKNIQNSFGVASVSVGSHRVSGVNLARVLQFKKERLIEDLDCIHKILLTHRRFLQEHINHGLLPLYTKGFMFLNKQYSTIGFVGLYEGLQNIGIDIKTEEGNAFAIEVLSTLDEATKRFTEEDTEFHAMYNVEQIPAESMAVRLAKIDKELGFNTDIELYSNQYLPLTLETSIYDRLKLQGQLDTYTSGGAILHITHYEDKPIESKLYRKIIDTCKQLGVVYFAFNYAFSLCKKGHSTLGVHEEDCPICGAKNEGVFSRVVGFITKVAMWNTPRKKEFKKRHSAKLA